MRRYIGGALLALLATTACSRKKATGPVIQTATVTRQDIVVDVEATGIVQPVNAVQVRSKASGQIIKMPVQLGTRVKPGDLLVQIDPRQVRNLYNQATAALAAAKANLNVTKTQLDRAEDLAKQGVITRPELETAQLNYANAQAQLATATTNLDNARIALEDATIRAPIAGVIIEKDVSLGQVISSATSSASGGTLLLQMADLSQVMDSTLVSESDIGNVKPGLSATVHVDAYPNRAFHGVVQKIAPQATVQQSVTMFPVLISLDNRDGALLPGMNSDVSILVAQQDDALAVPIDAVRAPRDAAAAATALGLDPQKVRETVQTQLAARRRVPGETTASSGTLASNTRGTDGAGDPPQAAQQSASCDSIQAALERDPDARNTLRSIRQRMRDGSLQPLEARKQMQDVYQRLKIDPRAARACMMARRGANGGAGGPSFSSGGEQLTIGNTPPHPALVFVQQPNGTFEPRVITLGVSNYDVAQVLDGLNEGDRVALITAAMLQQSQAERQQRIQSRVGLPGVRQQQSTPRRGGT
ncbi:MAG: efflux RND transporter periplasmic adaptor subunit [Gemmatimonadaceae bacterium]|nr:efflux RND transporter periplasmic adaptor subunit [Gemmatimonadaceae bacterium]